jgi:hypothetical protein
MTWLSEAARGILRSPSRAAAALVAFVLLVDLPGTISSLAAATPGELGILAVIAPVTYLLGLYFIVRLWRRPTRTIVMVFLIVWLLPLIATTMGGGLDSGTIIPVALNLAAAVLAAVAWNEPRVVADAQRSRR